MLRTNGSIVDRVVRESHLGDKLYRDTHRNQIHEVAPCAVTKLAKKKMEYEAEDLYDVINDFTDRMIRRYGQQSYSLDKFFHKAKKYAKKEDLNAKDFELFKILYQHRLKNPQAQLKHDAGNKLSNILGSILPPMLEKANLKNLTPQEKEKVNQITMIAGRSNYYKTIRQNYLYEDIGPSVKADSMYICQRDTITCYVDPLIAAMFIPKIAAFENRMLNSNLSGIIRNRLAGGKGGSIKTKPDFDLLHDLTTDPNDTVCQGKNVWDDLLQRVILQETLRELVFSLRNGRVYDCNNRNLFLEAINNCKMSSYDSPHDFHLTEEGVVLRRLMNIFSYRPTYLAQQTVSPVVTPHGQRFTLGGYTRVPMIEVPLPPVSGGYRQNISLQDVFNRDTAVIENSRISQRRNTIVHSDDVLIFHVNRRFKHFKGQMHMGPYAFPKLPATYTGYEKANTHPVTVPKTIDVQGVDYYLRSFVFLKTSKGQSGREGEGGRVPCGKVGSDEVIVGTGSWIMQQPELINDPVTDNSSYTDQSWIYDPVEVVLNGGKGVNGVSCDNTARALRIVSQGGEETFEDMNNLFKVYAEERGTIFIYTPQNSGNNGIRNR
jgi:hypothetical protein